MSSPRCATGTSPTDATHRTPLSDVELNSPAAKLLLSGDTSQNTNSLLKQSRPSLTEKDAIRARRERRKSSYGGKGKRVSFGGQQVKVYEQHENEWHSGAASRDKESDDMVDRVTEKEDAPCGLDCLDEDDSASISTSDVLLRRFGSSFVDDGDSTMGSEATRGSLLGSADRASESGMDEDGARTMQSACALAEAVLAHAAFGASGIAGNDRDDTSATDHLNPPTTSSTVGHDRQPTPSQESIGLFMDEDITRGVGYPRMSVGVTNMTTTSMTYGSDVLGSRNLVGPSGRRRSSILQPPRPFYRRASLSHGAAWTNNSRSVLQMNKLQCPVSEFKADDDITAHVPSLGHLIDEDGESTNETTPKDAPSRLPDTGGERKAPNADLHEQIPLNQNDESFDRIYGKILGHRDTVDDDEDVTGEVTARIPSLASLMQDDVDASMVASENPYQSRGGKITPSPTPANAPPDFPRYSQQAISCGGDRSSSKRLLSPSDITRQMPSLGLLLADDDDEDHQVTKGDDSIPRSESKRQRLVSSQMDRVMQRVAVLSPANSSSSQKPPRRHRPSLPSQWSCMTGSAVLETDFVNSGGNRHTMDAMRRQRASDRRKSVAASVRRLSMVPARDLQDPFARQSPTTGTNRLGRRPPIQMSPAGALISNRSFVRPSPSGALCDTTNIDPSSREATSLFAPAAADKRAAQVSRSGFLGTEATFKDFLFAAGVRFLDDVSNRRRATSFGVPGTRLVPRSETLNERVCIACSSMEALHVFHESCKSLAEEGARLQQSIEAGEASVKQSWFFEHMLQKYHSGDEPALITKMQVQLKRLKNLGRLRARMAWYKWRSRHEQALQLALNPHLSALEADVVQMRGLAESLRSTATAADEDAAAWDLSALTQTEQPLTSSEQVEKWERMLSTESASESALAERLAALRKRQEDLFAQKKQREARCVDLARKCDSLRMVAACGDQARSCGTLLELQETFEILMGLLNIRSIRFQTSCIDVCIGDNVLLSFVLDQDRDHRRGDNEPIVTAVRVEPVDTKASNTPSVASMEWVAAKQVIEPFTCLVQNASSRYLAAESEDVERVKHDAVLARRLVPHAVSRVSLVCGRISHMREHLDRFGVTRPYSVAMEDLEHGTLLLIAEMSSSQRHAKFRVALQLTVQSSCSDLISVNIADLQPLIGRERCPQLPQIQAILSSELASPDTLDNVLVSSSVRRTLDHIYADWNNRAVIPQNRA